MIDEGKRKAKVHALMALKGQMAKRRYQDEELSDTPGDAMEKELGLKKASDSEPGDPHALMGNPGQGAFGKEIRVQDSSSSPAGADGQSPSDGDTDEDNPQDVPDFKTMFMKGKKKNAAGGRPTAVVSMMTAKVPQRGRPKKMG